MAGKLVLLVEPDQVLGDIYAKALRAKGYRVVHVTGAQDAVMAADDSCPDIVICELQLVGHSGIEFLYEFRSYTDWQSVPVIVLTSVPPIEFNGSRNGLKDQLGVDSFLYKPATSVTQLLRTIDEKVSK